MCGCVYEGRCFALLVAGARAGSGALISKTPSRASILHICIEGVRHKAATGGVDFPLEFRNHMQRCHSDSRREVGSDRIACTLASHDLCG